MRKKGGLQVTCNITNRNNEGDVKRLVVQSFKVTTSCISCPYLVFHYLEYPLLVRNYLKIALLLYNCCNEICNTLHICTFFFLTFLRFNSAHLISSSNCIFEKLGKKYKKRRLTSWPLTNPQKFALCKTQTLNSYKAIINIRSYIRHNAATEIIPIFTTAEPHSSNTCKYQIDCFLQYFYVKTRQWA
jgi:hypothetical protein